MFGMIHTIDKFGLHCCKIFEVSYRCDIHIYPSISEESLKLKIKFGELSACGYHRAAVFTS